MPGLNNCNDYTNHIKTLLSVEESYSFKSMIHQLGENSLMNKNILLFYFDSNFSNSFEVNNCIACENKIVSSLNICSFIVSTMAIP